MNRRPHRPVCLCITIVPSALQHNRAQEKRLCMGCRAWFAITVAIIFATWAMLLEAKKNYSQQRLFGYMKRLSAFGHGGSIGIRGDIRSLHGGLLINVGYELIDIILELLVAQSWIFTARCIRLGCGRRL